MTTKRPKNELRNPGHNFDGIEEYDNDMPRWWLNLFYVTIVFSIGYLCWYHTPVFSSKSLLDEYGEQKEQLLLAQEAQKEKAKESVANFKIVEAIENSDLVAKGKEIYDTNCMVCHGDSGQGLIGPNLTDNFWVHGSKYAEVSKTVREGILEKGMPAWEAVIGEEGIQAVLTYVKTLEGKGESASNAKPAEGLEGTFE